MGDACEGAEKIFEQLKTSGDLEMGRGWKQVVSRRLDHRENFVGRALQRGTLRVDDLMRALEVFEITPREFFERAFGPEPAPRPEARLNHRLGQARPKIPLALHRLADRLSIAVPESEPCHPEPSDSIRDLENLRFEQPAAAAGLAEIGIGNLLAAPGPLQSCEGLRLLAEWGSAQRKLDAYDEALWAIATALRLAPPTFYALRGDLFQRLALCYSDFFADYLGALEITDRAFVLHGMANHPVGLGRALIDRAAWLYYLEDYESNLAANRSALRLLPKSEIRHRFSGYTGMALAFRALGKPELALREVKNARKLDPGPLLFANALWLEGSLAREEGHFDRAEQAFAECHDLFATVSPINAALVGLELIEVYLRQGHHQRACKAATSLARWVAPLGRYPLAASALAQLIAQSLRAELSLQLLRATREALEAVGAGGHSHARP